MYDWITILTYVLCIYIYTLSLIVYIIIYCPYIAHGTYQLGCTPYWGFLKHKNDLTATRSVLPSKRGMAYWHMAQHGPPGGRIWHFQIQPYTICNFRIFQVYKKSSTATYSDRFAYLKHVRPPVWSIECRRSTLRDNSRCTCATSPWSSAFTGGLGYCSGAMFGGWFFLGRPTDQWMGVPAGNIGTGKVGKFDGFRWSNLL